MRKYKMYKRHTFNYYYDYKRRCPLEDTLVNDDFNMLYRIFTRKYRKTFDKSHSSFEKYENNTKTFEEHITFDSSEIKKYKIEN